MIGELQMLVLRAVSRYRPIWLWKRLDHLARRQIDGLWLVLSFDCDTPEDAEAVAEVDSKLRSMGVSPAYAVPGELLERFHQAYEPIRDRGAPFLNHGYTQHTFWSEERARYESCYFYDELSYDEVACDVERGHASVRQFLGASPEGFRTPHFGTFQKPAQLHFLYGVLNRLGYAYSSSTMPAAAWLEGPVLERAGLREIPVTGIFGRPLAVHDSWAFFAAPTRILRPGDYLAEARALVTWARGRSVSGVLNYYADPSHVVHQPDFFEAVSVWLEVARPTSFSELCRRL